MKHIEDVEVKLPDQPSRYRLPQVVNNPKEVNYGHIYADSEYSEWALHYHGYPRYRRLAPPIGSEFTWAWWFFLSVILFLAAIASFLISRSE